MAYALMAESSRPVDWQALNQAVAPIRKRVELFPIPGAGGKPDGLGMSVPQKNANDLGWEEFTQLADVLEKKFGMAVYDLKSGARYGPDTAAAIMKTFLGEDRPSED